jgi:hypothetical protein
LGGIRLAGDALLNASAPRDQVEDKNDDCDYEQEMNQTARDVEAEAQKPQHE